MTIVQQNLGLILCRKTYDDNLQNLIKLAEMTSSFEKKKPIIQLKPTAIMPAVTLVRRHAHSLILLQLQTLYKNGNFIHNSSIRKMSQNPF